MIFFFFSAIQFFYNRLIAKHHVESFSGVYGNLWVGVISIAFSLFVFEFLFSLLLPNLSKKITITTLLLVFMLSCFAIYWARLPRIKRIEVPIKGLSKDVNGFSIVQLSDLHLERQKSDEWLNDIVDKTNELCPDVVVITGDLLDRDIDGKDSFAQILMRLNPRYGVFAVMGNHEYYYGAEFFSKFCERTNINILKNESVLIDERLYLAGIDDNTGKRIHGDGPDLKMALKDCDFNKPVVLLSHQPNHFREAVGMGVDLQLSGHTHAGQIPPMNLIVLLIYKYPHGLYRYKSSFIYTTSGTGVWGPPMRLFSRSEIVYIRLVGDGA